MQMWSKIAVVAAVATTAVATAPEGSWGADGQWTTCTDAQGQVTTSLVAEPSAPAYETPSSYAAPASSSVVVDPVASSSAPAPSSYAAPPSSSPASPVSSAAPSGTPGVPEFPECWSTCFEQNGNPAQDALCDNTAVSDCVADTCEASDASEYEGWLAEYCGVPSSSSSVPVVSSSTPYSPESTSSVPASSYPVESYPAESSSTPASPESSSAAGPSSYKPSSYGPSSYKPSSYAVSSSSAPVSSSTPFSPVGTGTPNMPTCWNACFDQNGVTSQDALCGNADVGECIKETCEDADLAKYKEWLAKYCGGTTGSSNAVGPTGSYSAPPETVVTDVTTVYTTTCPASSEYTSGTSTLTSYYTTVSTVTATYQTTTTVPGGSTPTSTPGSPVGPSVYPVSTVVNTETKTYTLGHGSSTSVYTTTIESTSTIYQTTTVYLTKPSGSATEGSPQGPSESVFTSAGVEYSVSGTKTFTISSTSTLTNYITVYPAETGAPGGGEGSPVASSLAGGEGSEGGEACAPKTVTVTESEVVTVTVGGSGSGYPTGGAGSPTSDSGSAVGPIQSSSAPYYPTGSYPASSGVAGSSGFVTKTKSSAAPSGTGSSDCWGQCFSQAGITGKDALCGNDAVTGCIADTCGAESSAAYGTWLGEYCGAPSSAPASAVPSSSAPAPSSYAPASTSSSVAAAPVTTSSAPAPPAYETTSSAPAPPAYESTSAAPAPPAYETTSSAPAPPVYETPAPEPSTPVAPVSSAAPAEPSAAPEYTPPAAYSFAPESSSAAAAAPPAYTKL